MLIPLFLALMQAPLYDEPYRPQFHFSAKKNWLNDPNGLVFFDGQYHLFFQHNPGGIQWGDMHWGHAVSRDLFHWKELEPALAPDKLGTCFSGSAAVDFHNTCGLGVGDKPVMAAMYTAAGTPFVQCLVTSTDGGKTWTKYAHNPVLGNLAHENRDPRIFWHESTKKWVMALYLTGDEYGLFGSPDLIHWTELSRLHVPGSSECPELFEIGVDEESPQKRWIFYGGNYHYMVGQFDGTTFIPESEPIPGATGNFYASQTYSNAPGGRRIQIGWMNGDGPKPGMPFNQQMSCPCELRLRRTSSGLRLFRSPVRELTALTHAIARAGNVRDSGANEMFRKLQGDAYDIQMRVNRRSDFVFHIRGSDLTISGAEAKLSLLGSEVPIHLESGAANVQILIDRSSIEVFVNDGREAIAKYFTPPLDVHGLTLAGAGPQTTLDSLRVSEVKSAWR